MSLKQIDTYIHIVNMGFDYSIGEERVESIFFNYRQINGYIARFSHKLVEKKIQL